MAPSDLSDLHKLILGRSEYSLIYARIVDYLQNAYPTEFKGKIRQVGIVLEDQLFISFSKKWPDSGRFAGLLDQGLPAIREDGMYKKLEQKWQKPNP